MHDKVLDVQLYMYYIQYINRTLHSLIMLCCMFFLFEVCAVLTNFIGNILKFVWLAGSCCSLYIDIFLFNLSHPLSPYVLYMYNI